MDILIAVSGTVLGTVLLVRWQRQASRLDAIDWKQAGPFILLTLAGIVSREVYNVLVKTNATFNWTSLGIAMLVSPFALKTFFGDGNQYPEQTISNYALAYQNGFFWNSILETIGS